MTTPALKEGIYLVQNIVRGIKDRFLFLELFVMRFCPDVVLVFRDG